MDLNFTPEEEAFRAEVQAFLQEKLPARIATKVKAGQRLTEGTRHFQILAVTEADAEGRHLKCYASEEVVV